MLEERIGSGGFRLNSMMFGAWEKLTTDQKKACLTINNTYIIEDVLRSLKLVDFMIDNEKSTFSANYRIDKDSFFGNSGNGECEIVSFQCRNLTPCVNILQFMTIFICSSSSIKGIFEDQSSNKMLYLDLVEYGLSDITRTIAELTETECIKPLDPAILLRPRRGSKLESENQDGDHTTQNEEEDSARAKEAEDDPIEDPIKKRRSVLEKDYKEYYIELKKLYHAENKSDPPIMNVMKAVLTLLQNNIFYSIGKLIKLLKFYQLRLEDDARVLTNANAFRKYLVREILRKETRDERHEVQSYGRDQLIIDSFIEVQRRKLFLVNGHSLTSVVPSIYSEPFYINQE